MRLCLLLAAIGAPSAIWAQGESAVFTVMAGTRIPLSLINSVSTKSAAPGDSLYLETVFPIVTGGRIVIPPGSYVTGTVTDVKRPGKVKGRGEIYLRFDELILPNGVKRDFRARVHSLDGRSTEKLKRAEGKVESEGNKKADAAIVGGAAITGGTIGTLAGAASRAPYRGLSAGAAAGATAGLIGVLFTRGPEAVLSRGTTLEMVLDRELSFETGELAGTQPAVRAPAAGEGPRPSPKQGPRVTTPVGRRPF